MAAETSPLFYSTAEAATMLGVSPARVRTMWREGIIQGEQIGRLLKLSRASVRAFAGERVPGHERSSENDELREKLREARRVYAELGRVLAELEV